MCFFVLGLQGLHGREQQYIADGRAVGEEHHQTVDAVADTAGRRHTDIQRVQEVLVRVVRLFIARRCQCVLRLEALALVNRVVQLGVGVAHLSAVDEELKALHIIRVVRLLLRERRNLNRVVGHEGRLNHVLLAEGLKEEVQNIASLVSLLECDALLLRDSSRLFEGLDCREIDAAVLLDRLAHRDAAEGLLEVNLGAAVHNLRAAVYLARHVAEHVLGEVHHSLVVRVRLIELHQRELGVVAGIQALVPEHASYLVDALQTADNEAL